MGDSPEADLRSSLELDDVFSQVGGCNCTNSVLNSGSPFIPGYAKNPGERMSVLSTAIARMKLLACSAAAEKLN